MKKASLAVVAAVVLSLAKFHPCLAADPAPPPAGDPSFALAATLKGHREDVKSVAFSPGGNLIASGGLDGALIVWDAATGKKFREMFQGDEIESLRFSPDGLRIAAGGRNRIRVWKIESGECTQRLDSPERVHAVAFAPKGYYLASAGGKRLRIWDWQEEKCLQDLETEMEKAISIVFSWTGRSLLLGGEGPGVKIESWSMVTYRRTNSIREYWGATRALAFSPDDKRIVFATDSGLFLWVAKTDERKRVGKEEEDLTSVAFFPDSRRVVCGGRAGGAKIWDLSAGTCIQKLDGEPSPVHSVACAPDGRRIAAGCADGTVRIWEPVEAKTPAPPPAIPKDASVPRTPEAATLAREIVAKAADASHSLRARMERVEAGYTIAVGEKGRGKARVIWNRREQTLDIEVVGEETWAEAVQLRTRWAFDCSGLFSTQSPQDKFAVKWCDGYLVLLADPGQTEPGIALVSSDFRWLQDITRLGDGVEIERVFSFRAGEGKHIVASAKMVGREAGRDFATAEFTYEWAPREGIPFPERIAVSSKSADETIAFTLGLEEVAFAAAEAPKETPPPREPSGKK